MLMARKNSSDRVMAQVRAQETGFTLIELMIVVVIVAILGSIAYPNYRNYVLRANRSAAQSFMMSVASREEQLLLDQRTYTAAANNAAFTSGLPAVPADLSSLYTFSVAVDITGITQKPNYEIQAVPTGSQAKDPAGTIKLNSLGQKSNAAYWSGSK
jgi:type IV pilus assembly protein PilE